MDMLKLESINKVFVFVLIEGCDLKRSDWADRLHTILWAYWTTWKKG